MNSSHTFSSLSEAGFRWYWISTLFTYAAAQMDAIIKGWLIFKMTDSAANLGLVTMSAGIPLIAMSLFGGVLADRVDRLKLLLVTQAIALLLAVTICVLLTTGTIQFWHFVLLAALQGAIFAFIAPLRQSIIARLVRPSNLGSAVALSATSYNIMGIAGPAAVGLMLAFMLPEHVYYVIIACYLCGAFMLAFISLSREALPAARPFHIDMAETFRFVRGEKAVMGLLLIALISSFFCIPYIYMLPALASAVLHVDQVGFGFLCAAASAGALIGSLAAGSLGAGRGRARLVLVLVLMAVFGIFLALSARFQLYPLALILIFCTALTSSAYMTLCNTLILSGTPAGLHGRVISIFTMTTGLVTVGALPMGAIADRAGLPLAFLVSGAIAVLFALFMGLKIKQRI